MFIRYMSDLHREFGSPNFLNPLISMREDEDTVLVLAGDIDLGTAGIEWANTMTDRFLGVVYIPGNHEFYHNDWAELPRDLNNNYENVHYLDPRGRNRGKVQIGGVWFVGGTLWTDINNANPVDMVSAARTMNDYHHIEYGIGTPLKPEDTVDLHCEHRDSIFRNLKRLKGEPTVVVTHHLPSLEMIHPQYFEDRMSCCYASDLGAKLLEFDPKFWFFGHSHVTMDKVIGDTHFLSNPYGYHNYHVNRDFDVTARVEIKV